MTKKTKIAFLCSGPPTDKKIWSGTIFKMFQAFLAQGFEVEWIPVNRFTNLESRFFLTIENLHRKIFNRGFNPNHFLAKAFSASRKLQRNLKSSDADVIFAPTTITDIAFLKTNKPILYLNDATFRQLLNYYDGMSGFGWLSKKTTIFIERLALQKSDALVFSSNWAAKHAIDFYKTPKEKVKVIKFGSNSIAPEEIVEKDYSSEITFLFLGVEWERKGGQIALDTIKILRERNYPVKLQVVGCIPPVTAADEMNVIPFLNKNNPAEAQQIFDFLQHSHFMFMPTRADCTPISFCEAASYGLPVISTNTGGVEAIVESEKTGFLLPLDANAEQYADKIEVLLRNPNQIKKLSLNARKKYEEELNWDFWGEEIQKVITNLLKTKL
ncbi:MULTISPECIES: glycosyltransferase family 4 protein [unclassified Kaistella]|uniref:glycosyltransferase family 4 protein n=1 Tax=unclassified Kaistella TaxID=2762626 RepID=UPI002733A36E|nr:MULTISPECIES: glycosyltransferase family 4 protein [unclassified Kaistella]MDP2454933.1 glycosyltransferase family 4 protein [Kaistella sp. SH11-4b]MDP2456084.1 glycosyltransferase family 4 protein [Kaistella sp. SH40-3]MDP2460603.1 glycosyltransferase family 4 protein [Kaistella sp. SH19-2b]